MSGTTTSHVNGRASPIEVLLAFLRLGCTSFGGPIAHLGYFREEFVTRRKWLDDAAFTDIVGLCQFLPGPASSQVGFTIGLLRAGALGALAAWVGFTMPSALLMVAAAYGNGLFSGPRGSGAMHALELVAVAVIAQAVLGMIRSLTPDRTRATIAVAGAAVVLGFGQAVSQLAAIGLGAVLGLIFCRNIVTPDSSSLRVPVPRGVAIGALTLFALLLALPVANRTLFGSGQALSLFNAFYRSGALVFGGGHVVLPLLQVAVISPGWTDNATFLAGYSAAQAIPGPLFTFAAYLGAVVRPEPHGIVGAAIALVGIFLPGLLLVVGVLPFWNALRRNAASRAAFAGVNASVVGILLAALYRPVWTSAVLRPLDFVAAVAAFVALTVWKLPPWIVVLAAGVIGFFSAK